MLYQWWGLSLWEVIRLLYYLPMERMTEFTDDMKYIIDLEEENKKLKEKVSELEDISKDYDILSHDFITATGEIEFWKDEVERFKQNAMSDMKEITDLEIENKKLKEELDKYKKQYEHIFGDDELIYEEWLYD